MFAVLRLKINFILNGLAYLMFVQEVTALFKKINFKFLLKLKQSCMYLNTSHKIVHTDNAIRVFDVNALAKNEKL